MLVNQFFKSSQDGGNDDEEKSKKRQRRQSEEKSSPSRGLDFSSEKKKKKLENISTGESSALGSLQEKSKNSQDVNQDYCIKTSPRKRSSIKGDKSAQEKSKISQDVNQDFSIKTSPKKRSPIKGDSSPLLSQIAEKVKLRKRKLNSGDGNYSKISDVNSITKLKKKKRKKETLISSCALQPVKENAKEESLFSNLSKKQGKESKKSISKKSRSSAGDKKSKVSYAKKGRNPKVSKKFPRIRVVTPIKIINLIESKAAASNAKLIDDKESNGVSEEKNVTNLCDDAKTPDKVQKKRYRSKSKNWSHRKNSKEKKKENQKSNKSEGDDKPKKVKDEIKATKISMKKRNIILKKMGCGDFGVQKEISSKDSGDENCYDRPEIMNLLLNVTKSINFIASLDKVTQPKKQKAKKSKDVKVVVKKKTSGGNEKNSRSLKEVGKVPAEKRVKRVLRSSSIGSSKGIARDAGQSSSEPVGENVENQSRIIKDLVNDLVDLVVEGELENVTLADRLGRISRSVDGANEETTIPSRGNSAKVANKSPQPREKNQITTRQKKSSRRDSLRSSKVVNNDVCSQLKKKGKSTARQKKKSSKSSLRTQKKSSVETGKGSSTVNESHMEVSRDIFSPSPGGAISSSFVEDLQAKLPFPESDVAQNILDSDESLLDKLAPWNCPRATEAVQVSGNCSSVVEKESAQDEERFSPNEEREKQLSLVKFLRESIRIPERNDEDDKDTVIFSLNDFSRVIPGDAPELCSPMLSPTPPKGRKTSAQFKMPKLKKKPLKITKKKLNGKKKNKRKGKLKRKVVKRKSSRSEEMRKKITSEIAKESTENPEKLEKPTSANDPDFVKTLKEVSSLVKELHESHKIILFLESDMARKPELADHYKPVISAQYSNYRKYISDHKTAIMKGFDKMSEILSKSSLVTTEISKEALLSEEEVSNVISRCILVEDLPMHSGDGEESGKVGEIVDAASEAVSGEAMVLIDEAPLPKSLQENEPVKSTSDDQNSDTTVTTDSSETSLSSVVPSSYPEEFGRVEPASKVLLSSNKNISGQNLIPSRNVPSRNIKDVESSQIKIIRLPLINLREKKTDLQEDRSPSTRRSAASKFHPYKVKMTKSGLCLQIDENSGESTPSSNPATRAAPRLVAVPTFTTKNDAAAEKKIPEKEPTAVNRKPMPVTENVQAAIRNRTPFKNQGQKDPSSPFFQEFVKFVGPLRHSVILPGINKDVNQRTEFVYTAQTSFPGANDMEKIAKQFFARKNLPGANQTPQAQAKSVYLKTATVNISSSKTMQQTVQTPIAKAAQQDFQKKLSNEELRRTSPDTQSKAMAQLIELSKKLVESRSFLRRSVGAFNPNLNSAEKNSPSGAAAANPVSTKPAAKGRKTTPSNPQSKKRNHNDHIYSKTSSMPKPNLEPLPSTSLELQPSTSLEPQPSTSHKPKSSTSHEPQPSTSHEPQPSTSHDLRRSPRLKPKPSTSKSFLNEENSKRLNEENETPIKKEKTDSAGTTVKTEKPSVEENELPQEETSSEENQSEDDNSSDVSYYDFDRIKKELEVNHGIIHFICAENKCMNPGTEICTGCESVLYCSRNCQAIHWNRKHYKHCEELRKESEQRKKNKLAEN